MAKTDGTPLYKDLLLRPFDASELSSVAYAWQARAGADEFDVELSAVFEWCADHLVPLPGDGHAMQVYNHVEDRTHAILEMVDSRRGARTNMSKLLKIWVSPDYWDADRDPTVAEAFAELYAGILTHVIGDAMGAGVLEIRIYGRTEALKILLTRLSSKWGELNTDWSASMQGRWFVLVK